jgi:glutathione S-transferase
MHPMTLVIGNKSTSSWSMRPWLAIKHSQLPFEEVILDLHGPRFKTQIQHYSPTGKVPSLIVDGEPVWESIAICETIADLAPHRYLWPDALADRAMARAVVAEMHSGFAALRKAMPFRLTPSTYESTPEVAHDIQRICTIWEDCRELHQDRGPYLFGDFSIADAFYAPVAIGRFASYQVPLPPIAQKYIQTLLHNPYVQEWIS